MKQRIKETENKSNREYDNQIQINSKSKKQLTKETENQSSRESMKQRIKEAEKQI